MIRMVFVTCFAWCVLFSMLFAREAKRANELQRVVWQVEGERDSYKALSEKPPVLVSVTAPCPEPVKPESPKVKKKAQKRAVPVFPRDSQLVAK